MAFYCVKGREECTGCGDCDPKPLLHDFQGDAIYEGDDYYNIDGEIVAEGNLWDWAKQYRETAE